MSQTIFHMTVGKDLYRVNFSKYVIDERGIFKVSYTVILGECPSTRKSPIAQ